MSYRINAWLEQGQARLAVVDADSNHVRMAWHGSRPTAQWHALFRELMLLSAAQETQPETSRRPAPPDD